MRIWTQTHSSSWWMKFWGRMPQQRSWQWNAFWASSIKIWNLDHIFESSRHIDKHSQTIDSVSISTSTGIAVVVTRSCIGVWDFMTGRLKYTLANSALGAIITHALLNEEGTCIVSAESGDVLYWDMATREVIFQEKQPDVLQLFFYKNETCCIAVSRWERKTI